MIKKKCDGWELCGTVLSLIMNLYAQFWTMVSASQLSLMIFGQIVWKEIGNKETIRDMDIEEHYLLNSISHYEISYNDYTLPKQYETH